METSLIVHVFQSYYLKRRIFQHVSDIHKLLGVRTIKYGEAIQNRSLLDYIGFGFDNLFKQELEQFISKEPQNRNNISLHLMFAKAVEINNHELARYIVSLCKQYKISIISHTIEKDTGKRIYEGAHDVEMLDIVINLLQDLKGNGFEVISYSIDQSLIYKNIDWEKQYIFNVEDSDLLDDKLKERIELDLKRMERILGYGRSTGWPIIFPYCKSIKLMEMLINSTLVSFSNFSNFLLQAVIRGDLNMLKFLPDQEWYEVLYVPLDFYFSSANPPCLECIKYIINQYGNKLTPGLYLFANLFEYHSNQTDLVDYMMDNIELFIPKRVDGNVPPNIIINIKSINYPSFELINRIIQSGYFSIGSYENIIQSTIENTNNVKLFEKLVEMDGYMDIYYTYIINSGSVIFAQHIVENYPWNIDIVFRTLNSKCNIDDYLKVLEIFFPMWKPFVEEQTPSMNIMKKAIIKRSPIQVYQLIDKHFSYTKAAMDNWGVELDYISSLPVDCIKYFVDKYKLHFKYHPTFYHDSDTCNFILSRYPDETFQNILEQTTTILNFQEIILLAIFKSLPYKKYLIDQFNQLELEESSLPNQPQQLVPTSTYLDKVIRTISHMNHLREFVITNITSTEKQKLIIFKTIVNLNGTIVNSLSTLQFLVSNNAPQDLIKGFLDKNDSFQHLNSNTHSSLNMGYMLVYETLEKFGGVHINKRK